MGFKEKSLYLPNKIGFSMQKRIRFEHNIKCQKSSHGIVVMKVVEIHDGMPVDLYIIPILSKNVDDHAKFRFYYPNYN